MSIDTEINDILIRYYTDKWNWIPDDLPSWPRYKRVWEYWTALAHYKRDRFYESLDEAGEHPDGTYIHVIADVVTMYQRQNGQWVRIQEIRQEEMKSLFGD